MSNFTVNGIYSYTSSQVYTYLGNYYMSNAKLADAFKKFGIHPTGKESDLKKLHSDIQSEYAKYSKQVKEQMNNQKTNSSVAWAAVCEKIGVNVTGDYEKDRAEFYNALQLLSQNAPNGEVQTYLAGIKTEASSVFLNAPANEKKANPVSYNQYQWQFWSNMI